MKLISFSKLNKYFILPFLVPILSFITNTILRKYIYDHINKDGKRYFLTLYINSSLIVGGLTYFISLIKSRTNKEPEIKKESAKSIKLFYIYKYGLKKNYIKKFGLLLLMSLLFAVYVFYNQLYTFNYDNIMDSRFFQIYFITYISKIILKAEIFRHHIFSLILSFIGFIILFIPIYSKIEKDEILVNITLLPQSLFYSLFLVLIKYLTCIYYVSPYLCCLLTGFFSTIITIILLMIHSYSIKGDLSNLDKSLNFLDVDNKFEFYFFLIISYIIFSLTQFFTYLTVYYFSPLIFLMTQIVFALVFWIKDAFEGKGEINDIIFNSIGYLLLLFAILINHEIIILNFWELNKYTKKYISERQEEEKNSIYINLKEGINYKTDDEDDEKEENEE